MFPNYIYNSRRILGKKRIKITDQRILVLEIFARRLKPVSVREITSGLNVLEKNIDRASVYRSIKVLKKTGLIHETSKGKFIACQETACNDASHCHHQFICTKCDRVTEVHIDDSSFISKINEKFPSILINSHNLSLSGLCERCRELQPQLL